MKTSKKVLGVLVALAMLVNVFAMFSFAAAPDSAVDLTLSVDKDAYSAGDVVTITVHEKVEPVVGDMRIGGQYAIGYDSAVINPLSTNQQPISEHGFTCFQEGIKEAQSGAKFDHLEMGDTIDEGYGWDSVYSMMLVDDGLTAFDATAGVDLYSFQMKLADNVADGDYVIGFNQGSFDNYTAYANDNAMGGVYGSYDDYNYGTACNYGFGRVTIHVGAPVVEGPKVDKSIAQVKFTYDNSTANGVADAFKFRVKSVITKADWDKYFTKTTADGKTETTITAVGMVAFPAKVDGAAVEYNADTAKAAALAAISSPNRQGQEGNYKAASTTYIQKADDASDAYFGAIIDTSHTNCQEDIKYVGFVQYDNNGTSEIIFYDTVYEATVASKYDDHVAAFKNL